MIHGERWWTTERHDDPNYRIVNVSFYSSGRLNVLQSYVMMSSLAFRHSPILHINMVISQMRDDVLRITQQ